MSISEVILPRRALPQPSPKIVEGGDCGPCCLAGMANKTIQEVYDLQEDGPEAFSWPKAVRTLHEAKRQGWLDRFIDDIPIWTQWKSKMQFGMPSWDSNLEWFGYVTMAIDAGYYGFCSVNYDGKGPLVDSDHVVLICGVRELTVPHKTVKGAACIVPELLVSCSATCPEGRWEEHREFLTKRGGYNILLARPAA